MPFSMENGGVTVGYLLLGLYAACVPLAEKIVGGWAAHLGNVG